MDFESLTSAFNSVAESTALNVFASVVFGAMMGGVGWFMGHRSRKKAERKADYAVSSGEMDGNKAIHTKTRYIPSGQINPKTSKEFYIQQIRNADDQIEMDEIFHPSVRIKFMKYLDEAKRYCTAEEPIVFQHLSKVIPPEKYEDTMERIITQWQGYFSKVYSDPSRLATEEFSEREVPVEKYVWPILVYEPGVTKKQERVLMLTEEQLDLANYPAPEDIMCEIGAREYVSDMGHKHMDRYRTNASVARSLQMEENLWIRNNFWVGVGTGEKRHVPEPEFAAS